MQTVPVSGVALPPLTDIENCFSAFCRAPHQFLLDRARTHGPVALYRLNDELFASVSDPEIAHAVFHGSMDDFEKGPLVDVVRPVFGNGIFTAEREDWSAQQKAIVPMFARQRLHRLTATIAAFAEQQVDRWRRKGDHEDDGVLIAMKRLAFEVVAVGLLSLDDESERDALFDELYRLERLPLVSLHYLGKVLPLDRLSAVVTREEDSAPAGMARANEILDAMVSRRLASPDQADDVIGALLASPSIGELPPDRLRIVIRDVIASLLMAGYVSTGESMFWILYQLARHPQVQARARIEALAANGPLVEPPPYLAAVINESMRLYPPAWYLGRATRRPMQLGGVDIPVGTQVLCSPFALHRSPLLWANPDTFSPERFLPGSTVVPRSFIPFGTGPRACIGRALSMMEMTSLASATLAALEIELSSDPPVTLTGTYSMQPRERICLRLRPRS